MSKDIFAQLVSFVFNPVSIATLVPFIVVYKYTNNSIYALKWFLFSLLFILSAVFFVLFGITKGYFSNFDITKKEERPMFFVVILFLTILFISSSIFLKGFSFPSTVAGIGILYGIGIFLIVNNFVKASGHMGVATGFVVTLWLLYGINYLLGTIWILPLLAWSRLHLKRHTKIEVLTGIVLGTIITICTFLIGRYIFN